MSTALNGAAAAAVRAGFREIEAKDPAGATAALGELDEDELVTAIEMIAWYLELARDLRRTRDAADEGPMEVAA